MQQPQSSQHLTASGFRILQRLASWALVAGAGFVALLAIGWVCFKLKQAYDYHLGFQQQRWLAAGEPLYGDREGSPHNRRELMVPDLLAHYLRPGMTRAQVLALLGPADSFAGTVALPAYLISSQHPPSLASRRAWCIHHSQTAPLLSYGVGWGLIDPTSLDIQLDSTNRVTRYWVHEH